MNMATPSNPNISDQAIDRLLNYWAIEQQQRQIQQENEQVVAVSEQGGMTCEYRYDSLGQLVQIIEPGNSVTTYEYDPQSRLQRVIHPDESTTEYDYGSSDRLVHICDRGLVYRFSHDAQGRLQQVHKGNAGSTVYRYDASGNVAEARTAEVSTTYQYSNSGQMTQLAQTIQGVTLAIEWIYDAENRLVQVKLPQVPDAIHYTWDEENWLAQVQWGKISLATVEYHRAEKVTQIHYGNGITETTYADAIDARPVSRHVQRGTEVLWEQHRQYLPSGQLQCDGERQYDYDCQGRLTHVATMIQHKITRNYHIPSDWNYYYNDRDAMIGYEASTGNYDSFFAIAPQLQFDYFGRLRYLTQPLTQPAGQRVYRYNDAHQLIQILENGSSIATLTYDAKGHVVFNKMVDRVERYVYGSDDRLMLVTDGQGNLLRSYVWTPLGLLAEIWLSQGEIFYRHQDDLGTSRLITDSTGQVCDRLLYSPYGEPIGTPQFQPLFTGHFWHPNLRLYNYGARWYDPNLAQFITPDSYTGAPDDERIVNAITPASKQLFARADILSTWLKYP
ncbi:MAG: RHS repeat-associated core domain-containing protein, partial [Synechococcales bacterium]|nr:RHS repeat-associated core domain-containing protein [Synechococcales bacterium]